MRAISKILVWVVVALALGAMAAVGIDLYNDAIYVTSSAPTGKTSGGPGTVVDLRPTTVDSLGTHGNVFRSALVLINVGVFADSTNSGKYTFTLEESDDDYDYTEASGSDMIGSLPTLVDSADGSQTYPIQYTGVSRYIRPNWTVEGEPDSNVVACPFSILILKLEPKYRPAR